MERDQGYRKTQQGKPRPAVVFAAVLQHRILLQRPCQWDTAPWGAAPMASSVPRSAASYLLDERTIVTTEVTFRMRIHIDPSAMAAVAALIQALIGFWW
jgi:hypothetical protein